MNSRQSLAEIKRNWSSVYAFTVIGGRYAAVAKFGKRETLKADSVDELWSLVRRHYSGTCADPSST
jgi:hypothetical protein